MATSTSAKIIYWSYVTNAIFQIVDVVAWLHPPLLCPQAREPVAKMFVRGQSVLLAPLLIVFWLFRSVPLQGGHDEATRTLTGIARGVAFSFVLFHGATIAWCAGEVYALGTEMTKTHLIFCFHGFYAAAVVCAYRLSALELKRM
jgi:hypothetical protein